MTTDLASMVQHAVPSASMTDATELERRLARLVDEVAAAKRQVHDLVTARNEVMREMNREHGVHPKRLKELGNVNLQLAYRIVAGEDR